MTLTRPDAVPDVIVDVVIVLDAVAEGLVGGLVVCAGRFEGVGSAGAGAGVVETSSGTLEYIVVKPTVLTTTPTSKIVMVERIGISTREMAIQEPSGHRIGVVVEVDVPIVSTENAVEVVVIVVRIGFVATGTEAAIARFTNVRRETSHRIALRSMLVLVQRRPGRRRTQCEPLR